MLGTVAAGAGAAKDIAGAAGSTDNSSIGPTTTTSGAGLRDINISTGGGGMAVPWWGWVVVAVSAAGVVWGVTRK